jgi:hypothetical protein
MFIGHLAVGLAAKRVLPHASLAVLLAAAQLADLLWPVLLALGLEQVRIDPGNTAFTPLDFVSYPYSHSLLLLVVWGVVFGLVYRRVTDARHAVAVITALVVSHWVLDVVTHRPDMPLYPGGTRLGLSLWNSIPSTLAVELGLYAAGVAIYVHATRARDAIGRWVFLALAVFLPLAYVAAIGSVPPSLQALWVTALVGAAVLTAWSWWADAHRSMREA